MYELPSSKVQVGLHREISIRAYEQINNRTSLINDGGQGFSKGEFLEKIGPTWLDQHKEGIVPQYYGKRIISD